MNGRLTYQRCLLTDSEFCWRGLSGCKPKTSRTTNPLAYWCRSERSRALYVKLFGRRPILWATRAAAIP